MAEASHDWHGQPARARRCPRRQPRARNADRPPRWQATELERLRLQPQASGRRAECRARAARATPASLIEGAQRRSRRWPMASMLSDAAAAALQPRCGRGGDRSRLRRGARAARQRPDPDRRGGVDAVRLCRSGRPRSVAAGRGRIAGERDPRGGAADASGARGTARASARRPRRAGGARRRRDLATLEGRASQAEVDYLALARALSAARRKVATRFAAGVSKLIDRPGDAQGAARRRRPRDRADGQWRRCDRVPRSPRTPAPRRDRLRAFASGGELSRIGLAIATLAAADQPVPTLIFDEADAGIGGTVANVIGELMQRLGHERQVLCVTHLPQVASRADHHLLVARDAPVAAAPGRRTHRGPDRRRARRRGRPDAGCGQDVEGPRRRDARRRDPGLTGCRGRWGADKVPAPGPGLTGRRWRAAGA